MEIDNLIKILNGDVALIGQVNVREVALSKDHVLIRPHHVKKMLKKFLSDDIDAFELTKWAKFIYLRAEYDTVTADIDPLTEEYDEVGDYYQNIWTVISYLSTPEIDGDVTKERVKQYLNELDKYKDDDMRGFFKK